MGSTDSREEECCTEVASVQTNYTMGSELGNGAFGKVYSARHVDTGCEVAIKVVDATQTSQEEFEHEAKMLKVLQHPRVVHLHAAITVPNCWAFVMDVYKGGSVDTVVQAHWSAKGLLPLPALQNVTRQMVEAVAWLHEKNIVHRDLKQTNFLVDLDDVTDPEINVVLCDVA